MVTQTKITKSIFLSISLAHSTPPQSKTQPQKPFLFCYAVVDTCRFLTPLTAKNQQLPFLSHSTPLHSTPPLRKPILYIPQTISLQRRRRRSISVTQGSERYNNLSHFSLSLSENKYFSTCKLVSLSFL